MTRLFAERDPLKEALARLVERQDLSREAIALVFEEIFSGRATSAQIGALLVALRMKGETSEEIAGAAQVMRAKATKVKAPSRGPLLDTCGTGGDGAHTFNLSTATALVAAGAGAVVAKHGNRSVSSSSGSADVLAAAGVNVEAPLERVEASLEQLGIGFLFAPALHSVMRHVIGPRREVGVRSLFNVLGPLSNPAGAPYQLLGVYAQPLVTLVAHTLAALGTTVRALVVHGADGLDEVSPCGPTHAALVEGTGVRLLVLNPEDAGLPRARLEDLRGGDPAANAATLRRLLAGEKGPLRDAVLLNAAAALWVAQLAGDLREGVAIARTSIDEGRALEKLEGLVRLTRGDAPRPASVS
jgi:anthranilate phosphoribosyltransferase